MGEVWAWLEENGDALKAKLEKHQKEVVEFFNQHKDKIMAFIAENKEELEEFAEGLEKAAGEKIDWDAAKAAAEQYWQKGNAKIEAAKAAKIAKKAAKE